MLGRLLETDVLKTDIDDKKYICDLHRVEIEGRKPYKQLYCHRKKSKSHRVTLKADEIDEKYILDAKGNKFYIKGMKGSYTGYVIPEGKRKKRQLFTMAQLTPLIEHILRYAKQEYDSKKFTTRSQKKIPTGFKKFGGNRYVRMFLTHGIKRQSTEKELRAKWDRKFGGKFYYWIPLSKIANAKKKGLKIDKGVDREHLKKVTKGKFGHILSFL